jgi:hypothetical protein
MGTTGHEIAVSIILITGTLLTIFGMVVVPISLVNYKPDNEHLFEMYSGIMKRKHSFTSTETSLFFMAFLKLIQLNLVTSHILSNCNYPCSKISDLQTSKVRLFKHLIC